MAEYVLLVLSPHPLGTERHRRRDAIYCCCKVHHSASSLAISIHPCPYVIHGKGSQHKTGFNCAGFNHLGTEGGRRYNLKPYSDYTGFAPVNSAYSHSDARMWQPQVITDSFGLRKVQAFVTPQYAYAAAPCCSRLSCRRIDVTYSALQHLSYACRLTDAFS